MNPAIPLKQRLFSADLAGVVITPNDLKKLGEGLGAELPKKNAEALLDHLIAHVRSHQQEANLMKLAARMIQNRQGRLQSLCESYPATQMLFSKNKMKSDAFAADFEAGLDLD